MANKWQQWYAHDISDWNASYSVQTFTDAAYRAYHTLLMAQFESEDGMLPNDHVQLARLSRMGVRWQEEREKLPTIAEEVLAKFEIAGERIYDKRMLREWNEARRIAEEKERAYEELVGQRKESGKRGLETRWGADSEEKLSRSEGMKAARAIATHTEEEWQAMIEVCEFSCARCCTEGPLLKDHIRPVTRGGSDGIDNIQPLCKSCTSAKGRNWTDYRPEDWENYLNALQTPSKRLANAWQTPSKRLATPSFTLHNNTEQDKDNYKPPVSPNGDTSPLANETAVTGEVNAPSAASTRPEEFANAWNRLRGELLPRVREFTADRRKKVKARMAGGLTLSAFEEAVGRCTQSPFLRGENDRGWKADFDWLMQNGTTVTRVLEGKYDGTPGGNAGGGNQRNSGGAGERVRANQEAIRRAVEKRGIFDPEPVDGADGGSVPAPAVGRVTGDLLAGLRVAGGEERPSPREAGTPGVARHAGPQILSAPFGGR